MNEFNNIYVGLDSHKATIAVGIAQEGREAPLYYGEIAYTEAAVAKLVKRLSKDGQTLHFCYEAGPCGYELQRQIQHLGHACEVIAPALIPRKAGQRMKTDRRDALSLSGLYRAGELTPVWIPDRAQESIRDLTRTREDMKENELRARQQLGAFLLRHRRIYSGKSRWTQAHSRWLEQQVFSEPAQQLVLQEYIDQVSAMSRRVAALEQAMRQALEHWHWKPVVQGLMALRGVSLITAMTTVAELGDLTRFDSPRQLMGYLGLVPSEHSSGLTRRHGGITRTGNGHVRRVLVEAAWAYQFQARKTRTIERRAEQTSLQVQAIAWEAQKRLCGRYRNLLSAGKRKQQAVTAVARELAGFIWAIACEVQGKPHASKVIG